MQACLIVCRARLQVLCLGLPVRRQHAGAMTATKRASVFLAAKWIGARSQALPDPQFAGEFAAQRETIRLAVRKRDERHIAEPFCRPLPCALRHPDQRPRRERAGGRGWTLLKKRLLPAIPAPGPVRYAWRPGLAPMPVLLAAPSSSHFAPCSHAVRLHDCAPASQADLRASHSLSV